MKGSALDEDHIARAVDVAVQAGLIYEVEIACIHQDDQIILERHRQVRCEMMTAGLTERHRPSVVERVWRLRRELEAMPLQLYLQLALTGPLMWKTFRHATMYYSQREPASLASFHWTIDAKNLQITDAELWWSELIGPTLQTLSLETPFDYVMAGDYSQFAVHLIPAPDWLVAHRPELHEKQGLDLQSGFRDVTFSPQESVGLELVDILTNAVRRSLTGRLREAGYQRIGQLMIYHADGAFRVKHYAIGEVRHLEDVGRIGTIYGLGGRPMFPDPRRVEMSGSPPPAPQRR